MKPLEETYAKNALNYNQAGINIKASRIDRGEGNEKSFPRNVLIDEEVAAMLDQQSGVKSSAKSKTHHGAYEGTSNTPLMRGVSNPGNQYSDKGGASRFFYVPKPSKKEKTCQGHVENSHLTVKPIMLMRYLCKMVAPPKDALILDPFCGSGTTCVAALEEGFDFIGIEKDERSHQTATERVAFHENENALLTMFSI
jgi:DNA modification methylase